MKKNKPLGHKSYGHIPHLPDSRMGPSDHKCSEGQARIATSKARDKHDTIIVQEKLDGSNVSVAKINSKIVALTRAGYTAKSSPFKQHDVFNDWVEFNKKRFAELLKDGERICGEWLYQAHGTMYDLWHEPFVAFDIMVKQQRLPYYEFLDRVEKYFVTPKTISRGDPMSIKKAIETLQEINFHGAIDPIEGAVWRVERNKIINKKTGDRKHVVDFLVKFVRPDKQDGIYLPCKNGGITTLNKNINAN